MIRHMFNSKTGLKLAIPRLLLLAVVILHSNAAFATCTKGVPTPRTRTTYTNGGNTKNVISESICGYSDSACCDLIVGAGAVTTYHKDGAGDWVYASGPYTDSNCFLAVACPAPCP